jgi:hypothetical protein
MLINNKVKKEIKAKRKKASKIFWTCHYIEKKYPQPIFIALFWLSWIPLIAYIKLSPQFSPLIALADIRIWDYNNTFCMVLFGFS